MDTVRSKSIVPHYLWWLILPGDLCTEAGRFTIAAAVYLPCRRPVLCVIVAA